MLSEERILYVYSSQLDAVYTKHQCMCVQQSSCYRGFNVDSSGSKGQSSDKNLQPNHTHLLHTRIMNYITYVSQAFYCILIKIYFLIPVIIHIYTLIWKHILHYVIHLCCKRALLQLLSFVRTAAIHENTCPHIYTTNW